ncbi:hypothetical protein [Shewanella indica]|uniref:hypothetical protein n=1 Tax=Shewanella indica TaxID=768528 RepID=UPI001C052717|nr:hypothetical protein [Shewanella indica]QWL03678.1 hypothetical protein JV206_05630 [Shewanella indica]
MTHDSNDGPDISFEELFEILTSTQQLLFCRDGDVPLILPVNIDGNEQASHCYAYLPMMAEQDASRVLAENLKQPADYYLKPMHWQRLILTAHVNEVLLLELAGKLVLPREEQQTYLSYMAARLNGEDCVLRVNNVEISPWLTGEADAWELVEALFARYGSLKGIWLADCLWQQADGKPGKLIILDAELASYEMSAALQDQAKALGYTLVQLKDLTLDYQLDALTILPPLVSRSQTGEVRLYVGDPSQPFIRFQRHQIVQTRVDNLVTDAGGLQQGAENITVTANERQQGTTPTFAVTLVSVLLVLALLIFFA